MTVFGFGLMLVCVLALTFGTNFSIILGFIGVVFIALQIIIKKHFFNPHLLCIAVVFTVASIICTSSLYFQLEPCKQLDNKSAGITAQLIDNPEIRDGICEYTFKTLTINGNKKNLKFTVYFSEPINISPYDEMSADAHFQLNESGKHYDWADGIMLRASVHEYEITKVADKPFHYQILRLRQYIHDRLYEVCNTETASTICALVLNDKSGFDSDTISAFNALGLAHAMAVSGMHVAIICSALFSFLTLLKVKPRVRSIICIITVLIYLCAVGFAYSAVRSGVMIIIILSASIARRNADPLNSLGFACTMLTIINPFAVIDTGFLLSVTATLGMILMLSPMFRFSMKLFSKFGRFKKVASAVLTPFLQSICAIIFTLPVIFATFGTLSVISPLMNIICAPLFYIVICCGVLLIITLPLPLIPNFLGNILKHPTSLLLNIIKSADEKFDFRISVKTDEIGLWIAGCLLIFAVCAILFSQRKLNSRRILCIASVLCIISLIPIQMASYFFNKDVTKVTFLDCGNGVCAVIEQDGQSLVCGVPKSASYDLVQYGGTSNITKAVFPALSDDYYEDTAYVLRSLGVDSITANDDTAKFYELLNAQNIPDDTQTVFGSITAEYKSNSVKIAIDNTSLLFLSSESNISAMSSAYKACDIVVVSNEVPNNIDSINARVAIVCTEYDDALAVTDDVCGCADEFYFTAGRGDIQLLTRGKCDINLKREN